MSASKQAGADASCVLTVLRAERLRGALPGLVLTPDGPEPAPGQLSCCAGRGMRFDEGVREARQCDVRKRLERLRQLMRSFHVSFGGERDFAREMSVCNPTKLLGAIRRFAAYGRGECPRGLVLTSARTSQEAPSSHGGSVGDDPSRHDDLSLWALAAAGIWRFGYDVHVVSLARKRQSPLPAVLRGGEAPQIILVEHVDKLWDPLIADEFEALIAYAYKAMLPLWLELVVRPQSEAAAEDRTSGLTTKPTRSFVRTGQAFQRRLASMQRQAPLHWLEADALSKLPRLCDGVTPYLQSTVAPNVPRMRRRPPAKRL